MPAVKKSWCVWFNTPPGGVSNCHETDPTTRPPKLRLASLCPLCTPICATDERNTQRGLQEDFDLERRLWRIPTTKLGKPRHVPLSDGVLNLLSTVPRSETYTFGNLETGNPYVSIYYAWDSARRKAGLGEVRMHDLRHSFASLLINSGRSLYEVQKLLGHTQIKTTQRYAHLAPETLLAASNAATIAVGSVMGVMPNRVVDVPLVAAQG